MMPMHQGDEFPQLRSSGGLLHDTARFLAAYWAQRNGYSAYSEVQGYGSYKPDLVLRRNCRDQGRKYVVFVEVQEAITSAWVDRTRDHYGTMPLVIIDLKKLARVSGGDLLRMYEEVKAQMDLETTAPLKKVVSNDYYTNINGHRVKSKNQWRYEKHGTKEEHGKTD